MADTPMTQSPPMDYQAPDTTVSMSGPKNPQPPAGDDIDHAEIWRKPDGWEVKVVRRGARGLTSETTPVADRAGLDQVIDDAFGITQEDETEAHGGQTDQSAIPMAGENTE